MTKLSLAAQAVAKAALCVSSCDPEEYPYEAQEIAAAALRAAADQVVPEPDDAAKETFSIAALRHRWQMRDQLLAIATELEAQ